MDQTKHNQLMVLKDLTKLPPHITFEQFKTMWKNEKNLKHKVFIYILWITGGRVDDICSGLKVSDFDFSTKILNLNVKKVKKKIAITLEDRDCFEILNYINTKRLKPQDRLFGFTRQHAWKIIKKIGNKNNIQEVHPHKFRHGLAIHLLNLGVPIPIISARLGHANTTMTMQMYMKVTPDIQRQHMKGIDLVGE